MMKKWECTICGYIHEGNEPPDECPLCGADKSLFVEVTEKPTAAANNEPVSDKKEKDASSSTEIEAENKQAKHVTTSSPGLIKRLIVQHHLHPITVHMPNGIIPMAFVFVFLFVVWEVVPLGQAALYGYTFVLLCMPLVLFTGYIMWKERYRRATTNLFKAKIGASIIATLALFVLVIWGFVQPAVLRENVPGRGMYLFLSLILLTSVGLAGHLGGKLVFGGRKNERNKKKEC